MSMQDEDEPNEEKNKKTWPVFNVQIQKTKGQPGKELPRNEWVFMIFGFILLEILICATLKLVIVILHPRGMLTNFFIFSHTNLGVIERHTL